MEFSFSRAALTIGLSLGLWWPAKAAPAPKVAPKTVLPASPFSAEARAAMEEFYELLPPAETSQNEVLRVLALRNDVRPKPDFPANALLKWLDERTLAATTAKQKSETIQDFLLVARPLVRQSEKSQRRRGLKSAQKAIELAGDDIGLRADIGGAFLAPYLRDSDATGPFSAALLLDDLWPRFGRIIGLEIQSDADIKAMQKAAQTGPSDVPPLQIAPANELTVPFLQVVATVSGPRQGWAIYRLARLLREEGKAPEALFWFRRLEFGDGAGIFKRLLPLYDPNAAPVGTQSSSDINTARDENNFAALNAFALPAWENVKRLLPPDIPKAQTQFVADLKARAASAKPKRAPIYTQLAENLSAAILSPEETDLPTRRAAVLKADEGIRDALMALLKADGAKNVYYFQSQTDWQLLAEAGLLFQLSHFEALSGLNYQYNSRYDNIKSVASHFVGAADLPRALATLELWSAISYPGNHYEQALDRAADVLEKNGRLEDAMLCLEAIPRDSGMSGGLVWKAPAMRKKWGEFVKKTDRKAVATERQTPPVPEEIEAVPPANTTNP